ncbi:MAG TPA: hypothetical protein VMJ32_14420 [Pirellulales bacterium]|nr:hypothetical protein [Pirellulales bacterium]
MEYQAQRVHLCTANADKEATELNIDIDPHGEITVSASRPQDWLVALDAQAHKPRQFPIRLQPVINTQPQPAARTIAGVQVRRRLPRTS